MNEIENLVRQGHEAITKRKKEAELRRREYQEHADLFVFICSLTIISEYLNRVNKQEYIDRLAYISDARIDHTFKINHIGGRIVFDVDEFIKECRKNGLDLGEFDPSKCPSMLVTSMDHIRDRISLAGILKIDNDFSTEMPDYLVISAPAMELDNVFFGENFEDKINGAECSMHPGLYQSGEPLGKIYEKFRRPATSDSIPGDAID